MTRTKGLVCNLAESQLMKRLEAGSWRRPRLGEPSQEDHDPVDEPGQKKTRTSVRLEIERRLVVILLGLYM
jgi:hypothetical protein